MKLIKFGVIDVKKYLFIKEEGDNCIKKSG